MLLAMLCVLPIWNAASLHNDANYTSCLGTSVPSSLIIVCVLQVVLYVVTVFAFFKFTRPSGSRRA